MAPKGLLSESNVDHTGEMGRRGTEGKGKQVTLDMKCKLVSGGK